MATTTEIHSAVKDLLIKVWGSVDSPACEEFKKRATPIDVSSIIKPTSRIVQHYLLDGAVFSPSLGRGYLEVKKRLDMKENDVVLASYPKTGTTWVQEIMYSLLNLDQIDKPITVSIDIRTPFIEFPECGMADLQSRPSPKFVKSHLPYDLLPAGSCNKKYKIVATTRNPKDAAVSFYHFLKMLTAFQFEGEMRDVINMFLNDANVFGPFWKHALSYWNHRNDGNVLVVKYEDLHNDIYAEIRRIAKFLEVEVNDELVNKIAHRCGFEQMSQNPNCHHGQWADDKLANTKESQFMRKGKIGDWKNHFDDELNKKFDEWIEKHFGSSDLRYQYE